MNKKIRSILGVLAFLLLTIGATGCTQQDSDLAAKVIDERFVAYADSEFQEVKGKEPVTLFFHADWCVTCISLEKEINENIDELPEGVKIVKVNFDKEAELKKEYGILLQSTFVILDKDGNVVEKLAAPTFENLKNAIVALL